MSTIVYFHDPVEVSKDSSWTGLRKELKKAELIDIKRTKNPKVLSLFRYARPDAVVTVNDIPVVSIEQTKMNPSGHNIPQRFSFHMAAAEDRVPSILYYPAYSRRTYSDPNVRYLNVRVPQAQKRLSHLTGVPALSVFWPTNKTTKLPETSQAAHQELADIVAELVSANHERERLLSLPSIANALKKMEDSVALTGDDYDLNDSFRQCFPGGFKDIVDPPNKAKFMSMEEFTVQSKNREFTVDLARLLPDVDTVMIFRATANKNKTDSEHPWPGYFTLLDVLYAQHGYRKFNAGRRFLMVYSLPIAVKEFCGRVGKSYIPTASRIVDSIADVVFLRDGIVFGKRHRSRKPTIYPSRPFFE